MPDKIPAVVVKHMIESNRRDDAMLAQYFVLHETVAMLIGHLHRAGVVDAHQLSGQLLQTMAMPEIQAGLPGVTEQAAALAGRIQQAACPKAAASGSATAGS